MASNVYYGGTYTSVTYGTYPTVKAYDGTVTYTYYLPIQPTPPPGNSGINKQWATIGMYDSGGVNFYCWGPGLWYNGQWWCNFSGIIIGGLFREYFDPVNVGRAGTQDKEMIVFPGQGLCIWYAATNQWYCPNINVRTPV